MSGVRADSERSRVGRLLLTYRKARRLTQEQLGAKVRAEGGGVSPSHIALIELGKRHPSTDALETLSNALILSAKEHDALIQARDLDEIDRISDTARMQERLARRLLGDEKYDQVERTARAGETVESGLPAALHGKLSRLTSDQLQKLDAYIDGLIEGGR
jgi:transcriptional regulator with XRE-family HTH domain